MDRDELRCAILDGLLARANEQRVERLVSMTPPPSLHVLQLPSVPRQFLVPSNGRQELWRILCSMTHACLVHLDTRTTIERLETNHEIRLARRTVRAESGVLVVREQGDGLDVVRCRIRRLEHIRRDVSRASQEFGDASKGSVSARLGRGADVLRHAEGHVLVVVPVWRGSADLKWGGSAPLNSAVEMWPGSASTNRNAGSVGLGGGSMVGDDKGKLPGSSGFAHLGDSSGGPQRPWVTRSASIARESCRVTVVARRRIWTAETRTSLSFAGRGANAYCGCYIDNQIVLLRR